MLYNSNIYVKYLIQSLTWYLMARLWGSSYQTWKSWLPSLRKSSVKWNSIKTKYAFAPPNHLYSNIGVDDSSSHFRPFSARANHCTTWFKSTVNMTVRQLGNCPKWADYLAVCELPPSSICTVAPSEKDRIFLLDRNLIGIDLWER